MKISDKMRLDWILARVKDDPMQFGVPDRNHIHIFDIDSRGDIDKAIRAERRAKKGE